MAWFAASLYYGVGAIPVIIDLPLSLAADTLLLPAQLVRRHARNKKERARLSGPLRFEVEELSVFQEFESVDTKPQKNKQVPLDPDLEMPDPGRYKAIARSRADLTLKVLAGQVREGDRLSCAREEERGFAFEAKAHSVNRSRAMLLTDHKDFQRISTLPTGTVLTCVGRHRSS